MPGVDHNVLLDDFACSAMPCEMHAPGPQRTLLSALRRCQGHGPLGTRSSLGSTLKPFRSARSHVPRPQRPCGPAGREGCGERAAANPYAIYKARDVGALHQKPWSVHLLRWRQRGVLLMHLVGVTPIQRAPTLSLIKAPWTGRCGYHPPTTLQPRLCATMVAAAVPLQPSRRSILLWRNSS